MLAEIQRLNTDIEVLAGRLHAYSDELKSVGLGVPPPAAAFNLEGAKVRPVPVSTCHSRPRTDPLFSRPGRAPNQALAANLKSLVSD